MTKLIHTADVHLREYQDHRWQALEEVLNTAKQQQASLLTISGDLFDQDSVSQQLREKVRALFSKYEFQIVILPGNHDVNSYSSGEYYGENVHLINNASPQKQKTLTFEKISFAGIPFAQITKEQLIKKIEEIDQGFDENQTNILMVHGELTDLFFDSYDFGNEGDKRYLPFSLNMFANTKIDYVLAGHFHTKFHLKKISNTRLKNGGFFVYPGSPVSITSRELGPRSVAFIQTNQSPKQLAIDTHHYQPIEISLQPNDDLDIIKTIEDKLQKLSKNCTGILTVGGFFNKEKIGLSETELFQKVSSLSDSFNAIFSDELFTAKEVSSLFSSSLYQAISTRINLEKLDPEKKRVLLEELTNALTK